TGVITRKGAWYSYKGDNIGQGRDNTIKYLDENPELAKTIQQEIREKLDKGAVVSANSVAHPGDIEEDDEVVDVDD
ncbi:MAG: DNA recombination/repair protein RecA, partial [Phormidium sp.]